MKQNGKPQLATPSIEDSPMPMGGAGAQMVREGKTLRAMQIGGYTTAISVQKPRKLTEIQARVIEEAALLGADFMYGWEQNDKTSPTGKSRIEGVSIDGAMILARNWGNCVSDVLIEEDAPQHWVLRATFIDLETGYTLPRLFRQRKNQRTMRGDDDRGLDIAFQIGQSKAQRNVIVKAMPTWLVNAARDAALKSVCAKYEKDLPGSREKAKNAWGKQNVTVDMLVRHVGVPFEAWTARDLAKLESLYIAIFKERAVTIEHAFATEEPAEAATQTQTGTTSSTISSEPAPEVVQGEVIEPTGSGYEND